MRKSSPLIAILIGLAVYILGVIYVIANLTEMQTGMQVTDAYARAASPSAKAGAVFVQVVNNTDTADRLISARSDVANKAEIHTHKVDANGVMSMIHVEEGLTVEKGSAIIMERGGDHVMLMGLNKSLVAGQSVDLILVFEKAGEVYVTAPVDLIR